MLRGYTARPTANRNRKGHGLSAVGYHFPTKGIPVAQPNTTKKTAWETKERTSTLQKGITNEKYTDFCYYTTKHDVPSDVDHTVMTLLSTG
ncbi:hypothetical protein Tco_0808007 [Tanacetum coccineum]